MLRQIEWGVQYGPITKNELLPLTTLLFKKFTLSLRTSYNVPVAQTYIFVLFVSVSILFEGVFSL